MKLIKKIIKYTLKLYILNKIKEIKYKMNKN